MAKITQSPLHLLAELIESLGQASGAAGHLIFHYGNPAEMMILREAIDITRDGCLKLAKQNAVII